MRDQLIAAIEQRKLLTFTYDGLSRRVQPAAFGLGNRRGLETLHAYQVGGDSARGGIPHWRNFHLQRIEHLVVHDEVFGPNPPGYRPRPLPQTHVALADSPGAAPAPEQPAAPARNEVLPGIPISKEQAAKAVDVAGNALGALGKWLRKR